MIEASCCEVEKLEKEAQTVMEALRRSLRPDAVAPQQGHGASGEETAWVVDKGEGFSVDELLNLGEFGNIEPEEGEDEEDVNEAEEEQMETENNNNNNSVAATISPSPSSSGSALSCEAPPLLPPPLSEISLPAHDVAELEWVSFIIDDSSSEFPAGVAPFNSLPRAQTESDDSAQRELRLQPHVAAPATQGASFPYSTVRAFSTEAPVPARAKRSKRSRSVAVGWSSLPFADSSSSTTTATTTATSVSSCSSASSSLSSCLIYDHPVTTSDQSFLLCGSHPSLPLPPPPPPQSTKQKVPKKRGRKPKHPSACPGVSAAPPAGERRCSHCGVQKTPQWRAGPLGAKTLCNACGVRFKSGRLLPEYRPACSPTFQNAIHSNSHRKVLEMRRKKEFLAAAGPAVATC